MNRVQRGSSSSSSSSSSNEDQQDSSKMRAKLTEVFEEHFDKHCKYERFDDFIDGKTVIIHLRKCKCKSDYEDMSELAKDNMDLKPLNGKEIHYYEGCEWVRNKFKRNGHKMYVLKKHCNGCNIPRANAPMSTINS